MPWIARQGRPPSRREILRAFVCSLALGAGGCAGYRTVSPSKVVAPAKIRSHFPAPRRIVFHSTQGDSVVLDSVVTVEGTALVTGPDSITMRPSKAWVASSPTPWRFSSPATVRLPTGTVELREVHKGRTAVLLLTVLGAVVLLVAGAVGDSGGSSPPPSTKGTP